MGHSDISSTKDWGRGGHIILIRIRALKLSPPLDNQPVSLKIIGAIPNIVRFSATASHCTVDFP